MTRSRIQGAEIRRAQRTMPIGARVWWQSTPGMPGYGGTVVSKPYYRGGVAALDLVMDSEFVTQYGRADLTAAIRCLEVWAE